MATIYIDNRPYTVNDGQNLLKACLGLGFDLPYFCWHPALHSVGACRQCAVKVFRDENDKRGRIMMSCMTPAADGTRLSVDDPEAVAFRKSVIEWLMLSHPHDCPVCDEGGECHLQDMTVLTGHVRRRSRFPKRTHRNQDLGPFVNHEMNRCIQCYRCVRFYRHYAGGRDLDTFASHANVYFGRHADGPLENEFSGNLVEVCPTGVFTDKTFGKHYTRKWDLQTAPSVCVHCGAGCNTIPGERYGTLRRIRNRYNGEVNGYFLCDRGRFGYPFVNAETRIRSAARNGQAVAGDDAMRELASWCAAGPVIGIGSPRASLESNYALRALAGPDRFFCGLGDAEEQVTRTMIECLTAGMARSPSVKEIELSDAVFVLGEDAGATAPRIYLALRQSLRQAPMPGAAKLRIPEWDDAAIREALQDRCGFLCSAQAAPGRIDALATHTFYAAPDDLARLGFAVARRVRGESAIPGLSAETASMAETIARALIPAERPLIVSGSSLASEAVIRAASSAAEALCESGKPARLCLIAPERNSIGAALLGGRPLGEALPALESGDAQTLVILENDLRRRAAPETVERLLSAARHVVVIDHTLTAAAARADIVLPAATFAEESGTCVSLEGRAQRFFSVMPTGKDIRPGWKWVHGLLLANGRTPPWDSLDGLIGMIAAEFPQLAPIRKAAPSAGFRVKGLKVAREHQRCSGRTAIHADKGVREPCPADDPDSPLSFSMEGYQSIPPPALIPRFWAPRWNSVQSVNKFQAEVCGPLLGGDPGERLFEPGKTGLVKGTIPEAFSPGRGEWLVIPVRHIFGSEELSALSPEIARMSPRPSLAVNPEDLPAEAGRTLEATLSVSGRLLRVPISRDPRIPRGVAALAGFPDVVLPERGRLTFHGETGGGS